MAETLNFLMGQEQLHLTFGQIIGDLNSMPPKDGNELRVANALWAQKGYPFLDEYLRTVQDSYRAEANELDFKTSPEESRVTINRWVEEKTNDKIKDLIARGVITKITRLVLTNAIYFKGKWLDEFDPKRTKEDDFFVNGAAARVPMMNRRGKYLYGEEESFQILELPYGGKRLSMVVFLPKEKNGLKDFERMMTVIKQAGPTMEVDVDRTPLATKLSDWMSGMRRRDVIVSVPKFKMTSSFGLGDTLKSMGMKSAFSDKADFSGMNGNKDFFISAIIHKAYVDVNEEGTEAAAATAIVLGATAVAEPEKPAVFKADHPFIFLIRERNTGSILFMGRVTDPRK
jgi:serpin B